MPHSIFPLGIVPEVSKPRRDKLPEPIAGNHCCTQAIAQITSIDKFCVKAPLTIQSIGRSGDFPVFFI